MKPGWKVLALATPAFDKFKDTTVDVVAVLTSLNGLLTRTGKFQILIDDLELTEHLSSKIKKLSWYPAANLIVFSAVTFAGLGIIDVQSLSRKLKRPVMIISRIQEGTDKIKAALLTAGLQSQTSILDQLPPPLELSHQTTRGTVNVLIHTQGLSKQDTVATARKMLVNGHVPQPIIVAQRIAKLFNYGEYYG